MSRITFTICGTPKGRAAFAVCRQLWRQIMGAPTSECWSQLSRISLHCKALAEYLSILLVASSVLFGPSVSLGEDGHHGVGHETWHEGSIRSLSVRTRMCRAAICLISVRP